MNPDEALAKARALAKSGSVAEAANLYRQILARQPQNKKAKKELKGLQKSAEASEQQRGLEYDLQSLVALYSSGDTDRALAQAMHLKKIYPQQPLPLNIIGVIQNQRGNFEAAVKYCKQALELETSYGDALNNLSSALHKLGRLDEAESCYLRLLSVQGDDPDAFFNLANVCKEKGNFSGAARCYQKSLNLRPLYEPAHIALGQTLISLKAYPGALASFNKALELNPQSTDAHCGIGNLLHARDRSFEAISWHKDALKLDAGNLAAKYGMAQALIATGKSAAAVPLIKEYLAAHPDSRARHLLDTAQGNNREIASYSDGER